MAIKSHGTNGQLVVADMAVISGQVDQPQKLNISLMTWYVDKTKD